MKIQNIDFLYHGTNINFNTCDLQFAKKFKDFGEGFYLTTSFRQAQKWAQTKSSETGIAYIHAYTLHKADWSKYNILELLKYNIDWLNFICKNRLEGIRTDYDIIYDRMADSTANELSDELRLYNEKKLEPEMTIEKIKQKNNFYDQYCFKTQKAINLLKKDILIEQHKIDGTWKTQ